MSKLISGKDALIALANGEDVEFSVGNSGWHDFGGSKVFCPNVIMCGINQNGEALNFRLKPRTIKIGEFEVPAPDHITEESTGRAGYYEVNIGGMFYLYRDVDNYNLTIKALRSVFNEG